jgi:hypothetical protein
MLKDSLCDNQARGFKGLIYYNQGDEVSDGIKDRVVYFNEEEDSVIMAY